MPSPSSPRNVSTNGASARRVPWRFLPLLTAILLAGCFDDPPCEIIDPKDAGATFTFDAALPPEKALDLLRETGWTPRSTASGVAGERLVDDPPGNETERRLVVDVALDGATTRLAFVSYWPAATHADAEELLAPHAEPLRARVAAELGVAPQGGYEGGGLCR